MYLSHSSRLQSGSMPSKFLIVGAAGVATMRASSTYAIPLISPRAAGHRPSSTARTSSRKISSPSPRTIASIHGASFSTCWYMNVPWMPPRTVTAPGCISLAIFSSRSAV